MNSMVFAIDFTIKPHGKWGVIVEKFAGGEELRQPRVTLARQERIGEDHIIQISTCNFNSAGYVGLHHFVDFHHSAMS
ncbi:unnamed protein product [Calypogeia fissa]